MGLTDFPHFPVLPAPFSCLQETCCPQEPGDSAATKLQLQEAPERQSSMTFPHALSSRQYFRTLLQGLSCLCSLLHLSNLSVFLHFRDHPWGEVAVPATQMRRWPQRRSSGLSNSCGWQRPAQVVSLRGDCQKLSILWPRAKVH
jgi:hypothetical protein